MRKMFAGVRGEDDGKWGKWRKRRAIDATLGQIVEIATVLLGGKCNKLRIRIVGKRSRRIGRANYPLGVARCVQILCLYLCVLSIVVIMEIIST